MIDWVSGAAAIAFLLTVSGLALITRLVPLQLGTAATGKTEIQTLDGLRGIVALAVVTHHSIMAYLEHARGLVGEPENYFQNQLGSTGVAMFFMISAYLFCGSLVRNDGRLELVKFVEGRLWRIVPLYVLLICMTIFCAFYLTGFTLLVEPQTLAKTIARLWLFNFVEIYPVNTADVRGFIGQIWTLRYEWLLYASLPVLGFCMRIAKSTWPLFAGLLVCSCYDQMFCFFLAGAGAAVFVEYDKPWEKMAWQVSGVIGLMIAMFGFHHSRSWPQAILLMPVFVAVIQGHHWFALLAFRPLRLLGKISFSIYMLHPFSLWIVLNKIVGADRYAAMGILELTGVIVLGAMLSIIFGYAGFAFAERPLMGRRPMTNWLSARGSGRISAPAI